MQAVAETILPPPSGLGVLAKYAKIFRVSLIERMTYRGDFFFSTILRFLPMLTTILLWAAIYEGAPEQEGGKKELAGFTYQQMVAYLLLVHISRMFSSMPGLALGITRDIREGTLKKYLIQPLDMMGYMLAYRMAHKTAYIITSILPYGLLYAVCWQFMMEIQVDPLTLLAYVLSLLLSFLIGFYLEMCLGMMGFWFLEVTSLLYVINTFNYFVSGHMFPLDIFPYPFDVILKQLPFQYLAYFPTSILLGKTRGEEMWYGLAMEAVWAVFFIWLSRWLYHRGLKHYSAYGG